MTNDDDNIHQQESTPLLTDQSSSSAMEEVVSTKQQENSNTSTMNKKDVIFGSLIHLGLALFVGLIISVLVRLPFSIFTWHPIFIILFIVFSTEGIALLQPTSTPKEKQRGLKLHAILLGTAYLCVIAGFFVIVYNKAISYKDHFTSSHGKFGLAVFCYLLFQFLFGLTIAYIPCLYGNVTKAKQLWKYHRMTGYVLVILVWITAQLGIRADYIYNNLYTPHLMIGHWIALAMIVVGLSGRLRLSKFGFSSIMNKTTNA